MNEQSPSLEAAVQSLALNAALARLGELAAQGDAGAVKAILDAAVIATYCVRSIHMGSEGETAREALHFHAEVSAVWPVLYNSMAEKRQAVIEGQIPPKFGTELPYSRKARFVKIRQRHEDVATQRANRTSCRAHSRSRACRRPHNRPPHVGYRAIRPPTR